MCDFTKTPSYFNNKETFEKYLGQTSYYLALQEAVKKIIEIVHPHKILELGSATGATAIKLAQNFPAILFNGIDLREDVVEIARADGKEKGVDNVAFSAGDMCEVVKHTLDYDIIYLLYSYHHILDPLEKKITFLEDAYRNMKKGAYLCVAETFIPEIAESLSDSESILALWTVRKEEGAASTFWKALASFDREQLSMARQIAEYSRSNEYLAGELVAKRQDEYLIKRSWLAKMGERSGFTVVVNEPVNALGDGIVLFTKD